MSRVIMSSLAVMIHRLMRMTVLLVQRGQAGADSMKIPAGIAGHAGGNRTPQGQQQSQQHQEPDAKDLHFFMLSRLFYPVSLQSIANDERCHGGKVKARAEKTVGR